MRIFVSVVLLLGCVGMAWGGDWNMVHSHCASIKEHEFTGGIREGHHHVDGPHDVESQTFGHGAVNKVRGKEGCGSDQGQTGDFYPLHKHGPVKHSHVSPPPPPESEPVPEPVPTPQPVVTAPVVSQPTQTTTVRETSSVPDKTTPEVIQEVCEAEEETIDTGLLKVDLTFVRGINLVHIPLDVMMVNGVYKEIQTAGDVYSIFMPYLIEGSRVLVYEGGDYVECDENTDIPLNGYRAVSVPLAETVTLELVGIEWEYGVNDGCAEFRLEAGKNLVGLPRKAFNMASDILDVYQDVGIEWLVVQQPDGSLTYIRDADDPNDIKIVAGTAFFIKIDKSVVSTGCGEGWGSPFYASIDILLILFQGILGYSGER